MNVEKRKITILTYNGEKRAGGVERVVYYLRKVLQNNYKIAEIKVKKDFGRWNYVFYPVIFSLRLKKLKKDSILISHGWQGFLSYSDFIFFHGTTKGAITYVPEDVSAGTKYIAWMEKAAAQQAYMVIAVSENCRRELIKFYKIPDNKIIVLNNAVDGETYFPKKTMKKNEKLRIVFSGVLTKRKGLDFLKALSSYIKQLDNVELWIACNNDNNIKEFAGDKNTYIKIGLSAAEMNDLYNFCDVLYFPSRYEGFSMASLEALSSGIPIVGSSFAIPEELQKYEFTLLYCENSPEKIVQYCGQMKKKFFGLSEMIHEQIIKDFGIKQYTWKLKRIIDTLSVK